MSFATPRAVPADLALPEENKENVPVLPKVEEQPKQQEIVENINNTIDYYKNLQAIKRANGNQENKVLDYEIKITRVKLENFGINLHNLEFDN